MLAHCADVFGDFLPVRPDALGDYSDILGVDTMSDSGSSLCVHPSLIPSSANYGGRVTFHHSLSSDADLGASVKAATLTSEESLTSRKSQLMSPPSRKKGGSASKENVCGTSHDRNHVDKHSGRSSGVSSDGAKGGDISVTSSSPRGRHRAKNAGQDVGGLTSNRLSASKGDEASMSRMPHSHQVRQL